MNKISKKLCYIEEQVFHLEHLIQDLNNEAVDQNTSAVITADRTNITVDKETTDQIVKYQFDDLALRLDAISRELKSLE